MLLLSAYACLTTGILLLQRTPDAVSFSTQDWGSTTGLRHTLHLAIPVNEMLTLLYPKAATPILTGTCGAKEGGWSK